MSVLIESYERVHVHSSKSQHFKPGHMRPQLSHTKLKIHQKPSADRTNESGNAVFKQRSHLIFQYFLFCTYKQK